MLENPKTRKRQSKHAQPKNRNVYVVRLDDAVLENKAFCERNPGYKSGKPCVYVGMTALTPDERFAQHKAGKKSGRGFVKKYGKYLMRKKFEKLNPMTYIKAQRMEGELAKELQRKGYAVWWN